MSSRAVRYRRALVLGLGASGKAAARLLLHEGAEVTAVDRRADPALRRETRPLVRRGAQVLLGCGEAPAGRFDVCVVSPSVIIIRILRSFACYSWIFGLACHSIMSTLSCL